MKKGDIVARNSYNRDIVFVIDRIFKDADNNDFAILKGLEVRVEADRSAWRFGDYKQ